MDVDGAASHDERLALDPALDGRGRRALERRSFVHAARPVASDLASTLLFYAVLAATGDARAAAALGVALGLAQVALQRRRGLPVAPLQWAGLALVVVLGGLTIATRDPRFLLFKASLVYAVLGAAMLRPGWMGRYLPALAAGRVPPRLVAGFERGWAALMGATGALNLLLIAAVDARVAALAMGWWAPCSKLALFAGQYLLFRKITRDALRRERAASPPPA